MRALAFVMVSLIAGCTADIPEGKLLCDGPGQCPENWICVDLKRGGRCYSSAAALDDEDRDAGLRNDESGRGGDSGGTGGTSGEAGGSQASSGEGGTDAAAGSNAGGSGGSAGSSGSAGSAGAAGSAGTSASSGNPCDEDNGGCAPEVSCEPHGNTVSCGDCPAGKEPEAADASLCVDIDECEPGAVEACGLGATDCENEEGGFECRCAEGFDGTGDSACKDINECAGSNVCTAPYDCVNEAPHYRCRGLLVDIQPDDSPSTSAFSVNGSGDDATVSDDRTGLTWRQSLPADTFTWEEAVEYCVDLGDGWRMPTLAELESLIDYARPTRAIDESFFPDTPAGFFWTSSVYLPDEHSRWSIDFRFGNVYGILPGETVRVRCVR